MFLFVMEKIGRYSFFVEFRFFVLVGGGFNVFRIIDRFVFRFGVVIYNLGDFW